MITLRRGQKRFIQLTSTHRLICFLARRQYGKTTLFAALAVLKMLQRRDHTIIFGSAKLNLSREIVRKEAAIIQAAIASASAPASPLLVYDAATNRAPDKTLSPDDFAELFEAQRLEFRIYHTRTSYSRTKVIALRPDAVGETGDLMCDEIGRINNWQDVWEAVEPIVAPAPADPPPDAAWFEAMKQKALGAA